ncbi:GNAT family N-acetyltransferase [Paenibacillus sp. RC67]|uniref:GNAT family N-acetyltransferase n=1 Tax=Paenibacillus sp. RC67 TaxID=3039392 RepID=UPI0024AD0443|nr:GNAT family N-acetyltransferase [Paenibacillus sp. RC67]
MYFFDSAELFLEKVGGELEKHEAVNNLLLGLLQIAVKGEAQGAASSKSQMALVEDEDGGIELVMLNNPLNAVLYSNGMKKEEAVRAVIAELVGRNAHVHGVVGPTEIARLFALEWANQNELEPVLKMDQCIYQLDQVNPIRFSRGQLKVAELRDHEQVTSWIKEFADSINEQISLEKASIKALGFIKESSIYLWDNDGAVSMAKTTRPTKHGIVLSYVYTPPQFRNQGYASSCVAALSQRMLEEGYSFCSLYTDLANPTSNHIYSQIGYRPIQASVMYRFIEKAIR